MLDVMTELATGAAWRTEAADGRVGLYGACDDVVARCCAQVAFQAREIAARFSAFGMGLFVIFFGACDWRADT